MPLPAAAPRRPRCTTRPWPTTSEYSARTTPAPWGSPNNLALAYWEAGRAAEALPLFEQTLPDRERVLGPDHPRYPGIAEQPRHRLPPGWG